MKRTAAMASFLLLAVGCGSSTGAGLRASPPASTPAAATSQPTSYQSSDPSAAPQPTSSPSPVPASPSFGVLAVPGGVPVASAARLSSGISCTGSIGASDPVAIVQLHAAAGTGESVLRDYADSRNPRTACTFQGESAPAYLIDSRHVVIGSRDCCAIFAVVDLPEVRYHWFQLPQLPGFQAWLLAVSPRLDEIAWLSNNDSTGADRKVHLTTKAGDLVVANLPPALGRCGAPNLSKESAYTHSGSHLFVLDQPGPDNTLIVLEGNRPVLSAVPPGGGWPKATQPEMAVWSPTSETLFYRQNGDVWRWTPGAGAQKYLPGVNWYYPTFTPDGGHLAYAVPRPDGLHDIYLIDIAHGGSPQLLKGNRNFPVFLNATQLWYWSEGQGICGPGINRPLVYDITNGSEAASIIDHVTAVWPATSSTYG